jgi:membrane protease subunit (stomatin/prohibitin family)
MTNDVKPKPQKDISRLKAAVRKLEKEKDKLFPDLGKTAYQAFLDGRLREDSLTDTFEKLKSLDAQIAQDQAEMARLTVQIEQMKAAAVQQPAAAAAVVVCPHCGSPVGPGLKFCGSCGKPLAPSIPTSSAPCANCGSPIQTGAKFCGVCGMPVAEAPAMTPTTAAPPVAAPPPPAPPETPAPAVTTAAPVDTGAGPRKCASCGATIEEADAEFCGECGGALS